jgi:hypothetical protein
MGKDESCVVVVVGGGGGGGGKKLVFVGETPCLLSSSIVFNAFAS